MTDSLASLKEISSLVKKTKSVNTDRSHLETYVFGLNLNSANQFCVFPIIECQTINRSDSQQEATIDACKKIKVEENHIVQKKKSANISILKVNTYLLLQNQAWMISSLWNF